MKIRRLFVLACLFIIICVEAWVLIYGLTPKYQDIQSKLEEVEINNSQETLLSFENISVHGRDYSKLICSIKNGKARIISLKSNEDTLWIPSSLGRYPVSVIGGDWTELPDAVEYAKKNQKTPKLGVLAWMENEQTKYEKVVIEEGIHTVFAESFYGIKTECLELPKSMLLLGALSFAESDIDKVISRNPDMYSEWGAFLNTEYQNKFPWTSPENLGDSIFADSNDRITYFQK